MKSPRERYKDHKELLDRVAALVTEMSAEIDDPAVTVEFPGCIVLTWPDDSWWFGTANENWGGNDEEGAHSIQTDVPSDSTDVARIAKAIVEAILVMR